MLPEVSMEGRLTADPELRFSPSGIAVGSFTLAANSRKKNEQTGEWEDDKVLFLSVTCFKQLAENVAESLRKGDLAMVTGRMNTDQWEDQQSGEKRSMTRLVANAVGLSLMMRQIDRGAIRETNRRRSDQGPDTGDPWASSPAPPTQSEEPPF